MWLKQDSSYENDGAIGEYLAEFNAFIIRHFGPRASATRAFECIKEATQYGLVLIEHNETNRLLVQSLADDDKVKLTPFIGLPYQAIAIAAIKE